MSKINVLLQTEIKKDAKLVMPEGWEVFEFSARGNLTWRDYIEEIAYEKATDESAWISFVSIPVAGFISRLTDTKLHHSLIFPSMHNMYDYRNPLFWNVWNNYIPDDLKLNKSGIIDTLGSISNRKALLDESSRVFIRPISPWKPFAGFDCDINDVSYELDSRVQLENVPKSELIAIYPYQKIHDIEWRVYVIQNEVVTFSAYSWDSNANLNQQPSQQILDTARQAALHLEELGDNYVIDVCTIDGEPKVLEINAISTSGWYPNIDTQTLLEKISSAMYGLNPDGTAMSFIK